MLKKTDVRKSCIIEQHCITVDGERHWQGEAELSFPDFAKAAFLDLNITYPKFYKMDALSKLTFLAAEYLLLGEDATDMALVLANSSGSLDTDVKHQESIHDPAAFYPRPATFVYTLPNICAGEIAIRHGLQTEQAFFVAKAFPAETLFTYADYLLKSGRAKQVLCGWVEYFQETYRAALYLL